MPAPMRSLLGLGLAALILFRASSAHAEAPLSEPAATPSESPRRAAEAPPPALPPVAPAPVLVPAAPRAFPTSDDPHELPPPSEPDTPAKEEESYGPQTIIVDGMTVGAVALAVGTRSPATAVGAGVVYGVGAPLVHLAHGRPGMALASFATRVSAPAMGGLLGFFVMSAATGSSPMDGAFAQGLGASIGVLTGVTAAVVLDAALYSHVWKKAPLGWDGKPSLAPQAAITPGGGSVGVGGTF